MRIQWKAIKKNKLRIVLILVMLLGAIGITSVILNTHQVSGQNGLELPPLPTHEPNNMPPYGHTPTHELNMTVVSILRTTEAVRLSLPKPTKPNYKTYDLSPELPDWQKFAILVQHSDGTIEQYNVGPTQGPSSELPSIVLSKLNLKQGDRIVEWWDIGLLNEFAPPTGTPTYTPSFANPASTQTETPYPYPIK